MGLVKLMMGYAARSIRPVSAVTIGKIGRAIQPAIFRRKLQIISLLDAIDIDAERRAETAAAGRVGNAIAQIKRVGRLGQRELHIFALPAQLDSPAVHSIRGQATQRIVRTKDGAVGGRAVSLHLDIGQSSARATQRCALRPRAIVTR